MNKSSSQTSWLTLLAALSVAALLDLSQTSALATTTTVVTWGDTGTDWNTPGDWSGGTAANSNLYVANFAGATGSLTLPNIAAATTVGGITFASTAGAYTISQTNTSSLTIDDLYNNSTNESGSNSDAILDQSAATETISAPVIFDEDGYSETVDSTNGGTLSLGNVSASGSHSLYLYTDNSSSQITLNGSFTLVSGQYVSIGASGSSIHNVGAVNFDNTGTVSYGGVGGDGITIYSGTVNFGSNSWNSGADLITVSGSGATPTINVYFTLAGMNFGAELYKPGASSGTITIGANVSGGGYVTDSGGVYLANATNNTVSQNFYAAANNTLNVPDWIAGGATTASFNKTGTGTVILSGNTSNTPYSGGSTYVGNSFVSPTTVMAGSLFLRYANVLAYSSSVTVNGGATLGGEGPASAAIAAGVGSGSTVMATNNLQNLTLTLGNTLGTQSTLQFDLGSSSHDEFNLTTSGMSGATGALTLNGTGDVNVLLTDTTGGLLAGGTQFDLLDWNANAAASSTVTTSDFAVASGSSANLVGGSFMINTNATTGVDSLIFTVPEPQDYALVLIGLGGLALVTRFRAFKTQKS